MKTLAEFQKRVPCCGILLSGGVDTAAIIEANSLLNDDAIIIQHAVTVLVSDRTAMDRPYSLLVAEKHNLNHTLVDEPLTTFLCLVPSTIRLLKTFDGMTLRNSLVIATVRFTIPYIYIPYILHSLAALLTYILCSTDRAWSDSRSWVVLQ